MGRLLVVRSGKLKQGLWLLSGFLVLVGFQNCAPSSEVYSSIPNQDTDQVRVIDDWALNKVNIYDQVIEASDELFVQGFCARQMGQDQPLTWKIHGLSSQALSGTVICQGGAFRIEVADVSEMACDNLYDFTVHTTDGHEDRATVVRPCKKASQ